ncbi:hypothetical protein KI387_001151, partial [Taxus chinensis]
STWQSRKGKANCNCKLIISEFLTILIYGSGTVDRHSRVRLVASRYTADLRSHFKHSTLPIQTFSVYIIYEYFVSAPVQTASGKADLRALHEKEKRAKGGLMRNQFFLLVLTCSFTYYVVHGYLFPMITSLSWICWIFPKFVLAQQLGSRLYGLGIDVIGIDWSTISSYLGSPLVSPWFAIANVVVGFVFVMVFYVE